MMNSLNAQLRSGESHDGPNFHHGRLSSHALIPLRAQAAVVVGLLAASSVGMPVAAIAAEPDHTDEGTAVVTQKAPSDPATSTEFDPGGDDGTLVEQPAPAPAPSATGNGTAPVNPAPTTAESEPIIDNGDGGSSAPQPSTETSVTPTGAAPTPADGTPPASAPTPPATPPTGPSVPAPAATPTRVAHERPATKRSDLRRKRHRTLAAPAQHSGHVTAPVKTPTTPARSATTAAVPVARRATPSDATHVVQPGESLWAIAADILGGAASPGQIAREVHRLWRLNAERIGTGNPALLMVGTRLDLR